MNFLNKLFGIVLLVAALCLPVAVLLKGRSANIGAVLAICFVLVSASVNLLSDPGFIKNYLKCDSISSWIYNCRGLIFFVIMSLLIGLPVFYGFACDQIREDYGYEEASKFESRYGSVVLVVGVFAGMALLNFIGYFIYLVWSAMDEEKRKNKSI